MYGKGKPKSRYSYVRVQEKINALANKGYLLIGTIPEDFIPWPALKLGIFLFVKNNEYYQYKASSFLFDPELIVTNNNEPEIKRDFSKIKNNDYIHLIFTKNQWFNDDPRKRMVVLREHAANSGHGFLMGGTQTGHEVVAGEVYFANSKLLLINPKSGSFRTQTNEAASVIHMTFGAAGEIAFSPAVEKDEVSAEIARRKTICAQESNAAAQTERDLASGRALVATPEALFTRRNPAPEIANSSVSSTNNIAPSCCIIL